MVTSCLPVSPGRKTRQRENKWKHVHLVSGGPGLHAPIFWVCGLCSSLSERFWLMFVLELVIYPQTPEVPSILNVNYIPLNFLEHKPCLRIHSIFLLLSDFHSLRPTKRFPRVRRISGREWILGRVNKRNLSVGGAWTDLTRNRVRQSVYRIRFVFSTFALLLYLSLLFWFILVSSPGTHIIHILRSLLFLSYLISSQRILSPCPF